MPPVTEQDRSQRRPFDRAAREVGLVQVVHVKSVESQERRTLLTSRGFLVNKLRDHENEIRGALRVFGLKVGQVAASAFATRIRQLVAGRARLAMCMEALLIAREAFDICVIRHGVAGANDLRSGMS